MPPLARPSDKRSWIALAQMRVRRVLENRVAATVRQLEVKVSESGPAHLRPDPHNLATALENMLQAHALISIRPRTATRAERLETLFYTLPEFRGARADARIEQLLVPYRLHRWLVDTPEYCSEVLEQLIQSTFTAAGTYEYLGRLPAGTPLDGVWRRDEYLVGVEAKNVREWVYPMSGRVWVMIRKCLELDAVPLLITREAAYLTRAIFARLGLFAFVTHRQVFSQSVAHLLTDIRHTDQLGYKDVIAVDPAHPHPYLLRFLQNTLQRHLPAYTARWRQSRALLTEFAIDRNLGDPRMNDRTRGNHYRDFALRVFYQPAAPDEADFLDL